MPISATNLNKAYLAYFGRPADAVGQAYFATLEQADVIKAFDASAESKAIYGGDTAAKINAIYKNLFNREAEPAGLTYWLSLVSTGRVTPAGAAFSILEGAEGTDKTAIDNKLAASEAFIKAMDTTTEIVNYSGLNAAASARAFLATVDASAASLTAAVAGAQAAVTSAISSTGSEASSDNVLKTTQDILSGTSGNDTFRGVAGRNAGTQDQTTLNSSDILDGGAGADTLIVNMTGATYDGGARIKNIETLQIGTNQAAATFDYNINAGVNEVTEVTTIVADQINNGTVNETLTINNIVGTVVGNARVMPTLSWVNDSNTAAAGTVSYNYRAAELTGTTDTQIVSLDSVNNGTLNLAAGIETVTLRSVAGERVTLLNSGNADTGPGNNNVAADIVSSGSLARVNIEAAAEVGKLGGRATGSGLIDNAAQTGLANAGTGENLLSVGSRVTTVDANTSTANVNVQFLAKTDGAATNVTFTGGAGNDYAEFEIGNINATGGVGNDTFAFVTQRNGVTNSTFGAGDSIVGGAGTDVIQIGVNGNVNAKPVGAIVPAGTSVYNISDSEWANKSGVEIVDLRGGLNTITLSSGFVAAPDAGVKLTVTTDNMVVGGTSDNEYNSVNTVDLRMLSGGQGINFVGGQGSDRLILSDSTYTAAMTLNGGSNVNNAGTAVAGDYDTLTVSNSAVLDRTDLSGTSGFEGLVLTKTVTGTVTTVIEMTEAFLLANTVATNSVTTSINDSVFQIGTAAGANGTALTAGDTVRIDVTDLFTVNNNTVKATVAARQIDASTLTAAGVTVQYVYNGTTYANLAALTAAVATVGGAAVLNGADAAGQTGVVGSGVAIPGPAALFFTGTAADESVTLVAAGNSVNMAGGSDTINVGALAVTGTLDGGTGADTLVMGAGAALAGATIQNVEAFTMNGAGSMTVAQYNAFTAGANAGSGADVLTLTTAGTITADADIETYTLAAGVNTVTLAGATAQTITGNTAVDTVTTTGANAANKTLNLGADAGDVLNVSSAFAADWTFAAAGGTGTAMTGVDVINLQGGLNTGVTSLTMFNGAATVNLTSVTGQVDGEVILGTGGQTVNVSGAGTGTYVVSAAAGADSVSITGSAGRVVINQGSGTTVGGSAAGTASLVAAVDTITGFRAGVDKIDFTAAGGANQLTTINIATSTSAADLAGALNAAVGSAITLAVANWDAAGDALMVNISSGTASGTYLVVNAGADATFDAAAELVVKLVGTVGVITQADIV